MTKKKKPLYGLSPGTTYKKARQFNDFDYIDKLSESEKIWLDQFAREYYQASFRKDGDNLHSDEQRRECYQANNERGRDMWTQMQRLPHDRSNYIADTVPPSLDDKTDAEDNAGPEDSIIEAIDKDEP